MLTGVVSEADDEQSRDHSDQSQGDVVESDHELDALREPPTGGKPTPRARTRLQELPFGDLEWPDIEKLCERLAELDGEPEYVSRYGTAGQDQAGIDIYSRAPGGGYAVYQCKRYQRLYPSIIRTAVQEFLDNSWREKVTRFVFCTSHSLIETSLADEIEAQAARLRKLEPPIVLDAWGAESLSRKLKALPDLVEDFFGAPFVDLFSPGAAAGATDSASASPRRARRSGWRRR
jgi:hypothetical protein